MFVFHRLTDFTRHLKRNPHITEIYIATYLISSRLLLLQILNIFLYRNLSFIKFISLFARRWDGNSYTFIAENWYTTQGDEAAFIVFPPLFPTLVKMLSIFSGSHIYLAFLLSNFFFVIGMIVFYKLLLLDYSRRFSLYIIFVLSIFPTSYFFSAAYPESLLLLLFGSSFLLARKGEFVGASILAGLATITRPFGISFWPALLIEWLLYSKRKKTDLIALLTSPLLFGVSYLGLNFLIYGNPFAFQYFLSHVWEKSYSHFWIGIWQSWKRGIYTKEWDDYKTLTGYSEAVASTLAWIFPFMAYVLKLKVHKPYLVFILVGALLFSSTGFILSAPRYLLSLPPFFIILAFFTYPKIIRIPFSIISVVLLFALAFIFAQGRWAF